MLGKASIVVALYDMGRAVGTIAVPAAIVPEFQCGIAGISLVDILHPAPPTRSGGEGANVPEALASGLTTHTAGADRGQL